MRKRYLALLVGSLSLVGGCDNFLDVNTNPDAPETVAANLYLPPMLHWLVTAPQLDGRFVARYTQQLALSNLTGTLPSTWDRMGYDPGSDNAGEQWRTVYWLFGQNLVDMMNKAQAEQRWDVLGVGYVLKAWGWQALTSLHGDIIIKQAIDPTRFSFDYDSQEYAYQEVHRLLDSAIVYLQRSDGAVDASFLSRGDKIYNGDRTKWLKFAYGLKAMSLNHFSNKASYKPAEVVALVDQSFTSNADDALLAWPGVNGTVDLNFLGPSRQNFGSYRQTRFILGLMDSTQFGAVDPRLPRMLVPSRDGVMRGTDPNVPGVGTVADSMRQVPNPWGFLFANTQSTRGERWGRYLFDDKVRMPAMTYAQLQFVKAEAAYRMGDKATALTAYRNGISAHIDFVNARNAEATQGPWAATQITAAEKAAFLADPRVVPTSPDRLTLTHIMSQKYIAQWAWAHNELWMDMRRYHYTDIDPASGKQVFPGFAIPTNLYADNGGKPVYRLRPRYNSEYVWNVPALEKIGGMAADYHTKPLWILEP